jgi:hypothetical protein
LHRTELDVTYEQRLRCGWYSWLDYCTPDIEVDEWELRGVSKARAHEAFETVKRLFHGQRYNVKQLLAFLPFVLWRRRGVEKDMRMSRLLVCSEFVWHFIEALGGNHALALIRALPEKDKVTPGDLKEFMDSRKRLFRRVKAR